MKLSEWLRALVAILGLAKAKPARIGEVERAAAAVEVVEAVISETETNLPLKK